MSAVLGREPHTLLDAATEATLIGLGCLAAAGGEGGWPGLANRRGSPA